MTQNNVVERGDEVRCRITGFQGVVTSRETRLQGVVRYDIQPPLDKDGQPGKRWTIDGNHLEIITKQKVKPGEPVPTEVHLGDEVEDTLTGFKGVITIEGLALNGCTIFVVQPKVDKDGKMPEAEGFDAGRLKLIQAKKAPEGQRKTGGPMEESRWCGAI